MALISARAPAGDAAQLTPALRQLEALAGVMERQTQALRVALDMAYASEAERGDVRSALSDIAMSIGIMAGSIELPQTDKGGPF